MKVNGVEVEETFAEAFDIKIARVLITAYDYYWAWVAANEATGFGTSVIMCPAEAGIEKKALPSETPDGRPGYYIQICHMSKKGLEEQLLARIGQCVLTAPTTAAFNGLPDVQDKFDTGFKLKFFGDGYEREVEVAGRKCYAIPMMQGEFIVESHFGYVSGIAGGNFFILGENQPAALAAAKAAVDAIADVEGVITPFPGGIVASGSKVGANKYKFLKASTNEKFCPTLRDKVEGSQIPPGVKAVYEIVINGLNVEYVKKAMKVGILAATKIPGVVKITAGNYGGKLGKHLIYLKDLF
ncbi:MAG: formylmethanofuran--tetrahydromethanopterin N-formyltransferase [Archaeoglobi archaeon]|jgi:formylmethanofuran--tetrahydromethanopterin N-formyltransferase|nr:formylmethanofuran--tetrahydromethanopterin N-formyltransferase [Archaeoglobus sp.]NHW88131.1 formylmethanofuran--tetrahydromethanopterin N-formyltransferase [Archaeoglobales archaeon]TDA28619.1 MAG: formylmethanofuran--tetrahydromethanopterin N-formyltransferase [Archaeoglobi archaeon]TDA29136.1 MAG: formylmethanofuran--tetrahydromethanopterin N-formyltransferase [Archaeoglobi archaeon]